MHELIEIYFSSRYEGKVVPEIMDLFDFLTLAAYKGHPESQNLIGLIYSGFFGTSYFESLSGISDTTHRGRDICALYWLRKAIESIDQLNEPIVLVDEYGVYAKVLIRVAMEQLGSTSTTGMCPIPRAYSSLRDVVNLLEEDKIDEGNVF
jgi:hypothetical protein